MALPAKKKKPVKKTKSVPKKVIAKTALKHKSKAKKHYRKVSKRIGKTELLFLILFSVLFITVWWVMHSVSEANRLNRLALKSSETMPYSEQDIKTAGIVGTVKQLKSEIKGWDKVSGDIHPYILRDYKQYKKDCVVNGQLAGEVSYELVNMTYNSYALVKKGCNGVTSEILKRFDNGWAVVYSGSAMIPCGLVNDLDIPQPVSYNCIDNGVVYVNPNP